MEFHSNEQSLVNYRCKARAYCYIVLSYIVHQHINHQNINETNMIVGGLAGIHCTSNMESNGFIKL